MTPKLLIVGADTKGSWRVRGLQIGAVLGARTTQSPTAQDFRWADVVILVKRALDRWGDVARAYGRPVIWDALDYWLQPEQNGRTEADCVADLRARAAGVTTVIGATKAMAQACGGVYIPHHHRPWLVATQPRTRLDVVAYEGTPKYLGAWKAALEQACAVRGLRFVINPPSLTYADVVVALRDGKHDGWACRQWKSGVKYVNAVAAGRPVISQSCAAYDEIQPIGVTVTEPSEIGQALDSITPAMVKAAYAFDGHEYDIRAVAARYRAAVSSVLRVAA